MPTVRVYSKTGDRLSVRVKELLRETGVAYADYDVDKNPSMKEEALALTKGRESFPVVLVDGKVLFGKGVLKDLKKEFGVKGSLGKAVSGFVEIKKRLETAMPAIAKRKPWEYLEPRNFQVGVTSGLPSVDRATLVEEAMGSIGKGCDLMRLDVESFNHLTPKDKEDLKNLSEYQGMRWAIHGDLGVDMTRSEETDWRHADKSLKEYIKMAKEIKAVYVNFHASVFPTPAIQAAIARTYEVHVDPDGKNIKDLFLKTPEAQRWFVKERFRGYTTAEKTRSIIAKLELEAGFDQKQIRKKWEELSKKGEGDVDKIFMEEAIKDARDDFDGRVTEWTAYVIVAWWMYKNGDSIWKALCGNKNPQQLIDSGDPEDLIKLVDAVAGAYTRGHLKKYLGDMEKGRVYIILENPDARREDLRGQRLFRLMHPTNIYHVVRSIGSQWVRLSIDWEHMAMHGYDPWGEAKKFPNDIGEFVLNFDVNSHPNVNHTQHPVERGDVHLYRLLWEVRRRGCKRAYLMYEWGGRRADEKRWQESVPALKTIAKMLENDVLPEELPPEFFGLDAGEVEFEKRIMERNMFKPFEGMLEFPELAHGWLSGELKKKGRLEQWAKEEFR